MSFFVNRIRYKGGSPKLASSSCLINKAIVNGVDFYDDDYNTPEIDYSKEYFTIESLEDGNTITLTKQSSATATMFYYSTNNGTTWTSHTTSSTPWTINLNAGDTVKLKSNTTSWCFSSNSNYHKFSSTKNFDIWGNMMSMTWGDDFIGKTSFRFNANYETSTNDSHVFEHLFFGCTHLINAENLILPSLTIPFAGYGQTFSGCTNLITAPKLPATQLYQWAYSGMFTNTAITSIIVLAKTWSNTNAFNQFLPSTNGTCYKDTSTTLPRGSYGIPYSWTIVDYTE